MDKLVVGRVLGVEAVAYYSVGVSVSARLLQVVGSLTHVLLPSSSEAVADKNYRRLYSLFWRSTKISAFLSLSLALLLLIFSRPILEIWMGTEFMHHSLSMFRILILGYAIFTIGAPAFFIANGMGFPWICSLGSLSGGCLTIILIALLGRVWGLEGVAWANWGYLINLMILFYVYWKLTYELERQV